MNIFSFQHSPPEDAMLADDQFRVPRNTNETFRFSYSSHLTKKLEKVILSKRCPLSPSCGDGQSTLSPMRTVKCKLHRAWMRQRAHYCPHLANLIAPNNHRPSSPLFVLLTASVILTKKMTVLEITNLTSYHLMTTNPVYKQDHAHCQLFPESPAKKSKHTAREQSNKRL